jgi:hypothetical protein
MIYEHTKKAILSRIREGYESFWYFSTLSTEFKRDRDIVIEAVQKNGKELEFASEELKNDKGVVEIAVGNHGQAIKFASYELQSNPALVLRAAKFASALSPFPPIHSLQSDPYASLRSNKEFIEDLAKVYKAKPGPRLALEMADDNLKSDKNFVLNLVKHNGDEIIHASNELMGDKVIALEALSNSSFAFYYISEELKNDKPFLLSAFTRNPQLIDHCSKLTENMKVYTSNIIAFFDCILGNWEKKRQDDDSDEPSSYQKAMSIDALRITIASFLDDFIEVKALKTGEGTVTDKLAVDARQLPQAHKLFKTLFPEQKESCTTEPDRKRLKI